jgi:type IV pilus assembly protein PilY1
MLHGFRDTTGAEVFAFVPKAVMPNMHQLAQRTYAHRYFVDGPNVEADACLGSSPCTWKNLLIGTAGAGAKTVFALDVTTPMAMTTTSVKWEIDPSTSGFATLGHVLSDVQTGYTKSGQWVAVFGNGYESAGGQAVLYIVNLNTGALIKSIVVDNTGSNGLGGVRLVRDANKVIVGAYAGDLKGKMWKFDLSSNSASSWSVGLSSSPLWTGPTTQPITQAPALVTHPLGGYVVAFGTGKLYQTTDVSTTTTQAMYGIWDSVPFGTTTTPSGVALNSTSTLVLQTISNVITATQVITASNLSTSTITVNYYSVSRNPVDWTTKRGWYIQWPNSGQRVIYPPETLLGRIVAVDTMTPISAVADDPCLQTNRGKAWNYVIEALTGRGPSTNVFDTNGNQAVELTDLAVSGYENTADGRTRYLRNTTRSTGLNTVFTPLSTQQLPETWISCSTLGTCAFVNRTWRQLYLR